MTLSHSEGGEPSTGLRSTGECGRVRGNRAVVTVTFYAALVAIIVGILFDVLRLVLPDAIAVRIGHNSEGFVLALIVAAWVQFCRPRLSSSRREWPLTALAAAGLFAVGVAMLGNEVPPRIHTLNESFLALALLVPYLQLRRPLPRRLVWWSATGVLVVIVLFNRTAAVTDLAEGLAILLLAPLAFDVVDRAILDPGATTSNRLRGAWYALLVLAPLCFSLVEYHLGVGGLLGEVVRYAVRVTEAFVCLLLVELYFAVALGRTGPREPVIEPLPSTVSY